MTLYDRQEVADLLDISTRSVLEYIKHERLPAVQINHRWYIEQRNLIAFLSGARRKKIDPPEFVDQDFHDEEFLLL